jgi:hypothetical protein
MDTPRRWQVASLATAAAGLGIGGLLVGRHPVEAVAPIELEPPATAAFEVPPAAGSDEGLLLPAPRLAPTAPDLVDPLPPESLVTPVTLASLASPDEPGRESASTGTPSSATSPRPSADPPATTSSGPAPAPDSPSSPGSPASVDSAASVDSD